MKNLRRPLIVVTLILIWLYISWRAMYTLPSGFYLIPGLLLLGSEFILSIQNTLFYLLIFQKNQREQPPFPINPNTIDIFVTTYNESLELVRRTILACKNLNYPEKLILIWICDDGRRSEMKELADSLGVGYITRNNSEHAKAGNLNNALKQTNGELVVTIDADMIPKPNFLQNTIGYFVDKEVAFVQTPQSFYNDDIYQYNLLQSKSIPNEQDLFMRLIQVGRDRYNSTIYIGSNTLFQRKALDSIGGFATGTITEDMATGMLLQSKGYKTIFHNEVLAQGLAAESLSDFLSQRIRWARGTIQTMRKWNPITLPGLSIMQRLLYMSSLFYWYFGVFRIIFLLAPILYLIFGISSLNASLSGILIFWLPYFILSILVENATLENRMKRFWSNIYETSVAPFLAWAVLVETITQKNIPFKVTPKGTTTEKAKVNILFMIPHLIMLVLSLIAMVFGIVNFSYETKDGIIINLFWLIYNLIIIFSTVLLARERPKFRQTERFDRLFNVELTSSEKDMQRVSGTTINVSETGCSIFIKDLAEIPENLNILVNGNYATHMLQGKLVYYDKYQNGFQLGIKFVEMENPIFQLWVKELFGEAPNESAFKYQPKIGFLNVFSKYYKDIRLPYKKKERISPRFHTNINCHIYGLPYDTAIAMEESAAAIDMPKALFQEDSTQLNHAILSDVGMSGCRIVLERGEFKLGDRIGIQLKQSFELYYGQVVRVRQQEQLELGIKWIDNNSGKKLLEYVRKNTRIIDEIHFNKTQAE